MKDTSSKPSLCQVLLCFQTYCRTPGIYKQYSAWELLFMCALFHLKLPPAEAQLGIPGLRRQLLPNLPIAVA